MIIIPQPIEIKFPGNTPFNDDEFFLFCQENDHLQLERTKEGNIIVMTPTGGETSNRNSELNGDLIIWNRKHKYGRVFDSNGGFRLPDGSMLAPDAAIVSHERWEALTKEERKKFPPLCPEFVVELKSESDRLATLQTKMQNWLANGVKLGWLIDPDTETAYIYQPDKDVEIVQGFDNSLSGQEILKDFVFELKILR